MLPRAASAGGGPDWVVAAHRSLFIGDVAEDGRAVARLAIDVEPTQANPGGFGAWEILDTPDLPSATGLAAASSEDDPYDDPLTTPRIAVAFGAPSGDPQGQSSTDAANALTIWSFDPAQPELANLSHWRARTADNSACFTPEILGRPSIALFREQLHIVALSEGVPILNDRDTPPQEHAGLGEPDPGC